MSTSDGMPESMILRLPTETLCNVFDYLAPGFIDHDFPDILSVRSTCRTFREITSQMTFWYDDHFHIDQLIPRRVDATIGKFDHCKHETRVRGLLESLKADTVVMGKIGLKKDWSFRTVATLIATAQSIPEFRLKIAALYYESYGGPPQSINVGLEYLGPCPNLKNLTISDEQGDVFLDLIPALYPALKKLEFYSNGGYSGSLRLLRGLEELLVWDHSIDEDTPIRENLLPFDSASSLRKLTLTNISGSSRNAYNTKLLTAFTNLSSFSITALCNDICAILMTTNFTNLEHFATTIIVNSNLSVDNIIKTLMSGTFRSLRALQFLVEPFNLEFNEWYLDIIKAVTKLSSLEHLHLTLGVNAAWCKEFSSLTRLKEIEWIAVDEEFCNTGDPFDLPVECWDAMLSPDEMSAIVTKNLKDTFRGFERQPSTYIHFLEEEYHGEWDNLG